MIARKEEDNYTLYNLSIVFIDILIILLSVLSFFLIYNDITNSIVPLDDVIDDCTSNIIVYDVFPIIAIIAFCLIAIIIMRLFLDKVEQ